MRIVVSRGLLWRIAASPLICHHAWPPGEIAGIWSVAILSSSNVTCPDCRLFALNWAPVVCCCCEWPSTLEICRGPSVLLGPFTTVNLVFVRLVFRGRSAPTETFSVQCDCLLQRARVRTQWQKAVYLCLRARLYQERSAQRYSLAWYKVITTGRVRSFGARPAFNYEQLVVVSFRPTVRRACEASPSLR